MLVMLVPNLNLVFLISDTPTKKTSLNMQLIPGVNGITRVINLEIYNKYETKFTFYGFQK